MGEPGALRRKKGPNRSGALGVKHDAKARSHPNCSGQHLLSGPQPQNLASPSNFAFVYFIGKAFVLHCSVFINFRKSVSPEGMRSP